MRAVAICANFAHILAAEGKELPEVAFIVADDHPMVRDALALALRAAFLKAEVALAGTLDEASAAIAARPDVDLVVLDLDMPGMQGLAGVSALRASYPSAPLVIVSATRAARMTPQQHRVFALMAEGKPNKIIAYDMQIGEATVKAHVTEILRKMGVHSRTQAIVLAQRLALDPAAPPPAPVADEA
jgi:DNA-binding NarL/FixJ family response regulator